MVKGERAMRRQIYPRWAAGLMALALAGSCALYQKDRCYLEDEEYALARELFIESGSLELTQLRLEDFDWRRCAVNEAVYRLMKEFEVAE
jgi:hypothetical protein